MTLSNPLSSRMSQTRSSQHSQECKDSHRQRFRDSWPWPLTFRSQNKWISRTCFHTVGHTQMTGRCARVGGEVCYPRLLCSHCRQVRWRLTPTIRHGAPVLRTRCWHGSCVVCYGSALLATVSISGDETWTSCMCRSSPTAVEVHSTSPNWY